MPNPRLKLQTLATARDQVLAVAHLVSLRNDARTFNSGTIHATFAELRIPAPGTLGPILGSLRSKQLIVAVSEGWALTPLGEQAAAELDFDWSEDAAAVLAGADLAGVRHYTIPPELAPEKFSAGVTQFLKNHDFEGNAFAITRFPRPGKADPVPAALDATREALRDFGIELHLASDKAVEDEIWSNVAASMWACRCGVAIIEDTVGEGVNRNLLIEVGAMLMTGRRCVLLKDASVPDMPTDLVGHIYKPVDLKDVASVRDAIAGWCSGDLGLPRKRP